MGNNIQQVIRVTGLLLLCAIGFPIPAAQASPPAFQAPTRVADAEPKPAGIEIVEHNHYPELHVDGEPFFIYSAAFFYYRTPRDQWETLLDRYSALGINTIDLYIPWNWHEPKKGEFDFDGHSNPRRDLRALLALIAQKHLRLIARPGPEILNEWRHGGFPDWLLEQPEFTMSRADLLEGSYATLDGLNARDAESAAQGWLANPTFMAEARAWFAAVGKELAPFSSHRVTTAPASNPGDPPRASSGPLLFVQLGDDFAEGRTNHVGPDFWRYCEELRGMIEAAGVDVPVFINPTDMRVPPAGSRLDHPIGVMGQWYMPPRSGSGPKGPRLDAQDAGEIEVYAEELATQPDFPPAMIEYQAGWYTPGDDDRPQESAPANTLLSTRLLIGNGLRGLNYFPLQDTYTPAGYSVPWASRSYRWDAALDPNGDPQPRREAVERTSHLLHVWGRQIAASHKRPDFGLIDPLGSYPQDLLSAQDVESATDSLLRMERLAALAMLSTAIRDPEYQPLDQLLNDPVLFLPVIDPDKPQFQISDRAQQEIVEYVRRGGTLVIFPEKPAGKVFDRLWQSPSESPEPGGSPENSSIHARWKFGEGQVIESTKDLLSWIVLDRSFSGNHAQPESEWAVNALRQILTAAGTRPVIQISGNPKGFKDLIASEIVTNEGTGEVGERTSGEALFSVTNLSATDTGDVYFEVLSPSASAKKKEGVYIPLRVVIPPRESFLLPIEDTLCRQPVENLTCTDSVVSGSGEVVDAKRDGRVMELTIYDPVSAEVLLRLAQHPAHVTLESTTVPEAKWTAENSTLDVQIPRGAAPGFLRVLRLVLPYFPQLHEIEKPSKGVTGAYETSVWNAIELPIGANKSLKTYPPLVEITPNDPPVLLISGSNSDTKSTRSIDISVIGPFHGGGNLEIPAAQASVTKIVLRPAGADALGLTPDADGLLHGTIKLRSGRDQRSMPVAFVQMPADAARHYQFDFDRDGAPEWVLEDGNLRLIVSPEGGGEAIALTDKSSGANLTTSAGLFRDAFSYAEDSPGVNPARAHGLYGLFNRAYAAEWTQPTGGAGLKLRFEAPDIYPAGAKIEKVIRFDGAKALQVNYAVALNSPPSVGGDASAADSGRSEQSFVAINSFPAQSGPDGATRFCWESPSGPSDSNKETPAGNRPPTGPVADEHCKDFTPGGKPLEIPEGVHSVQVRNPDRTGIELSWDCANACARLRIESKNFSALFRLQFPPLEPGAEEHYEISLRAVESP
jgi:hypothetical protein